MVKASSRYSHRGDRDLEAKRANVEKQRRWRMRKKPAVYSFAEIDDEAEAIILALVARGEPFTVIVGVDP